MGVLSDNVYLVKGMYGDASSIKDDENKSPNVYLKLRQLLEELTNSPKRDLNFKSNPCYYLDELFKIYYKLCKSFKKEEDTISILESFIYLKNKQYKTSTFSNVIIQDLINTIYGNDTMSSVKYKMINEDWSDMLYRYFTSPASKQILTKDKIYKAIENAPLVNFIIPNNLILPTTSTYKDELAMLLDKISIVETVKILDVLFTKVFIFDL